MPTGVQSKSDSSRQRTDPELDPETSSTRRDTARRVRRIDVAAQGEWIGTMSEFKSSQRIEFEVELTAAELHQKAKPNPDFEPGDELTRIGISSSERAKAASQKPEVDSEPEKGLSRAPSEGEATEGHPARWQTMRSRSSSRYEATDGYFVRFQTRSSNSSFRDEATDGQSAEPIEDSPAAQSVAEEKLMQDGVKQRASIRIDVRGGQSPRLPRPISKSPIRTETARRVPAREQPMTSRPSVRDGVPDGHLVRAQVRSSSPFRNETEERPARVQSIVENRAVRTAAGKSPSQDQVQYRSPEAESASMDELSFRLRRPVESSAMKQRTVADRLRCALLVQLLSVSVNKENLSFSLYINPHCFAVDRPVSDTSLEAIERLFIAVSLDHLAVHISLINEIWLSQTKSIRSLNISDSK